MKQTYLTTIALVLFLLLGVGSAAAGSFSLGDYTLVTGSEQTVNIPLNITTGAGEHVGVLEFSYIVTDPDTTLAEHGKFVPTAGSLIHHVTEKKITGYITSGLTGTTTIGYIPVTAKAAAGNLTLRITPIQIVDIDDTTLTSTYPVTSLNITITSGPDHIGDITIPADAKTFVGNTFAADANIYDSTGAELPALKPSWTSDNTAVLTIDKTSGICTLKSTGTATITATLDGYSIPVKTKQITVTGAWQQTGSNYLNKTTQIIGPEAGNWSAVGSANATILAQITKAAYTVPVPALTRDLITAPLLVNGDTGAGAGIAAVDNTGATVSLSLNADGTISIPDETGAGGALNYTITITGRKLGDVTGDNTVDSVDALKIARYAADLETLTDYQRFYADVNGKNQVTASDALAILELGAGMRDTDYKPNSHYWD